jgi:hypothetical protein
MMPSKKQLWPLMQVRLWDKGLTPTTRMLPASTLKLDGRSQFQADSLDPAGSPAHQHKRYSPPGPDTAVDDAHLDSLKKLELAKSAD